jgi:hypothetical protein
MELLGPKGCSFKYADAPQLIGRLRLHGKRTGDRRAD